MWTATLIVIGVVVLFFVALKLYAANKSLNAVLLAGLSGNDAASEWCAKYGSAHDRRFANRNEPVTKTATRAFFSPWFNRLSRP